MESSTQAPKKHTATATFLLIGPTILWILAFAFAFLANLTASSPADGELFSEANPLQQIFNVLVFICGGLGLLTWLPGIVIGIVLLVRKNNRPLKS